MLDGPVVPLLAPYGCRACLGDFLLAAWLGRCPDCHAINSLRPIEAAPLADAPDPDPPRRRMPPPRRPPPVRRVAPRFTIDEDGLPPDDEPMDLKRCPQEKIPRHATGHASFDEQFGGGFPEMAAIMLAGAPGAGKSRYTLELLARLAHRGYRCTVISGEEQRAQLGARGVELRIEERFPWEDGRLVTYLTNDFQRVLRHLSLGWDFALLDAINVFYDRATGGAAKSVRQLTAMSQQLHHCAWAAEGTVFDGQKPFGLLAICHGTKDGDMAGPMAAKHLFDAAYMLDHVDAFGVPVTDQGRSTGYLRFGCIAKNRYGDSVKERYLRMTPEPEGILLPHTPLPRHPDPT